MASIEHRLLKGDEAWRVVWRQDVRGTVRKQQRTFGTPDEASRFKMLVEGSGNRWPEGWEPPSVVPPAAMTFGQWALVAIDRRSRANERTKADYRRDLERHMQTLLDVPLADMSGEHVAAWLKDRQSACGCGHPIVKHKDGCPADGCRCKTAQPLAGKTIRNLHGFASSLMVDALAQHPPIATHNPFARKLDDIAAVRTEEMVFLTPHEFRTVLGWVKPEYQPLIRLLFGTGLRFGEAAALTARDVDLLGKRKTLTVTKAWKRTGPATWTVGEPKTKRSRRTLPLSAELVELLTPIWSDKRGTDLLFPGAGGGRLPHTEVWKRGWAPAVARANVCDQHYSEQKNKRGKPPTYPEPCDCAGVLDKTPRIHDLRHSHVAALINEGVRLEVISRRLGHSSIAITMDRYGHLDPSLDELTNAAVDRSLAVS